MSDGLYSNLEEDQGLRSLCLNDANRVLRFESMLADGTLAAIWRDINPLGDLDVRECQDLKGWLHYGSKNSRTVFDGEEAGILLPALKGKSFLEKENNYRV